jgi:uncharacterized protein YbbC (DUF1343 family)
MKYVNDNLRKSVLQKYTKVFGFLILCAWLISGCTHVGAHKPYLAGTITIGEDSLVVEDETQSRPRKPLQLGIERLHLVVDSLKGKRVAVVGNQTSVIRNTHLVDTLLSLKVNVVKVFSPEHGFRGQADAGELVSSTVDKRTGLPLVSLYGNHKKPTEQDLSNVDIIVFDIQDVGVRFYTYISTLHYVMEACAEQKKSVIVLDRPNPNAHYIDGPVLQDQWKSFVGMHNVPIVYGMTIGEYAKMINGEKWLANGAQCALWVVPMRHYNHKTPYSLPVAPSPNLKSDRAVELYPSLCLFEGTTVSLGRGTEKPFEIFGHPSFPKLDYSFVPVPVPGAKTPPQQNKLCYGYDLSKETAGKINRINLQYLLEARRLLGDSAIMIDQKTFFNKLAGTDKLAEQLLLYWSEEDIRNSWQPEIENFKKVRSKYLIYND